MDDNKPIIIPPEDIEVDAQTTASASSLLEALHRNGIDATAEQAADMERWALAILWEKYNKYHMNHINTAKSEVDRLPISIPNATKGEPYSCPPIKLPSSEIAYDFQLLGIDACGLTASLNADGCLAIEGTPTQAGTFGLTLTYKQKGWYEGEPVQRRDLSITVNSNPRDLWKDLQTPRDIKYFKEDTDAAFVCVPAGPDGSYRKDMVAASRRGRSHAHNGKARDDHFKLHYDSESDWYVMVVADGAGSAEYSREGSRLACETVVDYCSKMLSPDASAALEGLIQDYHVASGEGSREGLLEKESAVRRKLFDILGQGAFAAHRAIFNLASADGADPKKYATTLLVAIAKKFSYGWFVGTFWIGDGAICIYDEDDNMALLMGEPDEGEYSGQTRFLTMPTEMRDSAKVLRRIRFALVPEFTALMLMTDGVSDPMFGTDANLRNPEKWTALWNALKNGSSDLEVRPVPLNDDQDGSAELLDWLNFWYPGEHDDRTLAILY